MSSEEKRRVALGVDDEVSLYAQKILLRYDSDDDVLMEILKLISSVPSTVMEPVELCENTMKFSFRYHSSDSAKISRILMDISEKHCEVTLGYIGESWPLISELERISRYCNFTIFRFRIDPGLDEAAKMAMGKGSWERFHKQISADGDPGAIYRLSKQVPEAMVSSLRTISAVDRLYAGSIDNSIIKRFHELSDRYEIINLGTIDEFNGKEQRLCMLAPNRSAGIISQISKELADNLGDGTISQLPPIALNDALGVAVTRTGTGNNLL